MDSVQTSRLLLALSNLEQAIRVMRDLERQLPGNVNLSLAHGHARTTADLMRQEIRQEIKLEATRAKNL